MKLSDDIIYVGVNDRKVDLFEGMYSVPNGMSYNSYVIADKKIAVMDTVDKEFGDEWLANIHSALNGRVPDYLVVLHMEPDHSANIARFIESYPSAKIVGNVKTFVMIEEFFGNVCEGKKVAVADGDKLELGRHTLTFIFAPMVHWPEVMTAYEQTEKILFSADAFGKFGANDIPDKWDDEARRYYIGIVGKYGVQVQAVLKKLSSYDVRIICPLHGPVLDSDIEHYVSLYDKWSSYTPEENGVVIAYASVYGHTRAAAEKLSEILTAKGVGVKVYDLARVDRALCVSEAFRYSKLVLASTTYNGDIFPAMREFIDCLVERNFQSRTIAFIENGSWAPVAAGKMKAKFEKCKNLSFALNTVKIRSALNEESLSSLAKLAEELC